MNWRIVSGGSSGDQPLQTRVMAASMSVRRLAPLTLAGLAAMLALSITCLARAVHGRVRRTKGD